MPLTESDSQREAGGKMAHKDKKEQRKELFLSHHINHGLNTAIEAIRMCSLL